MRRDIQQVERLPELLDLMVRRMAPVEADDEVRLVSLFADEDAEALEVRRGRIPPAVVSGGLADEPGDVPHPHRPPCRARHDDLHAEPAVEERRPLLQALRDLRVPRTSHRAALALPSPGALVRLRRVRGI